MMCLNCWMFRQECSLGSISGCCGVCRDLTKRVERGRDPDFFTQDLIKTIDYGFSIARSELSPDPNLWHTSTILFRGTNVRLQVQIPPHANLLFTFGPADWGMLDNAIHRMTLRDFPDRPTNAFLLLRYLAVFCPREHTAKGGKDLDRRTFNLGYFILARISMLLHDVWGIINGLPESKNENRRFKLTELTVLRVALEDICIALKKGFVKPLINRPDFSDKFAACLRRWVDALLPFVEHSCSSKDEWWDGIGKDNIEKLRHDYWVSDHMDILFSHTHTRMGAHSREPSSSGFSITSERMLDFSALSVPVVEKSPDDFLGFDKQPPLPGRNGPETHQAGDISLPCVDDVPQEQAAAPLFAPHTTYAFTNVRNSAHSSLHAQLSQMGQSTYHPYLTTGTLLPQVPYSQKEHFVQAFLSQQRHVQDLAETVASGGFEATDSPHFHDFAPQPPPTREHTPDARPDDGNGGSTGFSHT